MARPRETVTVEPGKPSRTAWSVACRRAAHQLLDSPPLVFEDAVAVRILGADAEQMLRADIEKQQSVWGRAMRAFLVGRSRFAEDRLREAVEAGVRQYIVLGAGLDTFAYRNAFTPKGLQVFEVDHPLTQAWKRKLLAGAGIDQPGSVRFVPVNFETDLLLDALEGAGFATAERACVSWLGVTPYLTSAGFRATLGALGKLSPGSSLTFEYALEPALMSEPGRAALEALMSRVASIGEPFQLFFTPQAIEAELRACGFSRVEECGPEILNERYFSHRSDGLRMPADGARLVTAWV